MAGAPVLPQRSIDPLDYQAVPRPLAAMAKSFVDGFEIAPHAHTRDQFLFAVHGIMRVRTEREAWIVPPDRAVYIPAGLTHALLMRGNVEMRTLYIEGTAADTLPDAATVLEVSDLLRHLVLALIEEPLLYEEDGRGGAITQLILSEIVRANELSLVIPMPTDPRLNKLCSALLQDPSSTVTLEGWSNTVGASARTLARLFKQQVGMGFAAWRQRVRFHNAMEALMNGEPISRVASHNGYRSTSAFAAAFRKAIGSTPSAFRDQRRSRDPEIQA
jgi:AraC-like DNA-binding protein